MALNLSFKLMNLYSTMWIRAKARVVVKGLDDLPARQAAGKRVYVLLSRPTDFDLVALMHVSKEPFAVLADRDSAAIPLVHRVLRGARLIPFPDSGDESAVGACLEAMDSGKPLLVCPRGGDPSLAIRIAREAGAELRPVFLKVEDDRTRRLSLKGADGSEFACTDFKDSFYFIEFLKPIGASALLSESVGEEAAGLAEKARRVESRYAAYLEDNRERFAPLKRRGGSRMRVAW